eukprot:c8034_g1_i2.p1 GENE.c8034_g1_i2~~c8034_g1_i2.p1  ORF type:complete len:275 (+),score=77.98 c8034_g1_i2:59-883(+)
MSDDEGGSTTFVPRVIADLRQRLESQINEETQQIESLRASLISELRSIPRAQPKPPSQTQQDVELQIEKMSRLTGITFTKATSTPVPGTSTRHFELRGTHSHIAFYVTFNTTSPSLLPQSLQIHLHPCVRHDLIAVIHPLATRGLVREILQCLGEYSKLRRQRQVVIQHIRKVFGASVVCAAHGTVYSSELVIRCSSEVKVDVLWTYKMSPETTTLKEHISFLPSVSPSTSKVAQGFLSTSHLESTLHHLSRVKPGHVAMEMLIRAMLTQNTNT